MKTLEHTEEFIQTQTNFLVGARLKQKIALITRNSIENRKRWNIDKLDEIKVQRHLSARDTKGAPRETTIKRHIKRMDIYRVSQEECARLRESVPCVKVYRYNPKHLYLKLNGYRDNGQRSLKL